MEDMGRGTYAITTPDGVYVGRSERIAVRWYQHLHALRKGSHYSKRLQGVFNAYGEEALRLTKVSNDPEDEAKIGRCYGDRLLNSQSFDPVVRAATMRAKFLKGVTDDELLAECRERGLFEVLA